MIRVAVMYKNKPDARFDMEYYRDKHMSLVKECYGPHGLVGIEVDEALTKSGDRAAPYIAIGYLTFQDADGFMAAIKESGKPVMADVENFTDIQPVVQVSKVLTV